MSSNVFGRPLIEHYTGSVWVIVGTPTQPKPSLSVRSAWTLCSLAVYDLLVLGRGWGDERYQAWLTDTLARDSSPVVFLPAEVAGEAQATKRSRGL